MSTGEADERRIDAYLVCGGKYHDFDFARLAMLQLLAEDDHVRTQVGQDYNELDRITAADFIVTYTCDVRPDAEQQEAIRTWVENGGRWLALHGTNCALEPPSEETGGLYSTPRAFPMWAETLGSQFISHPPMEPYVVHQSPGAATDPLVAGIDRLEARDELYLMEHHGDVTPLLETRWTGSTRGFVEGRVARRRTTARAVSPAPRTGRDRVLHAGPLPEPLGHDRPSAQRGALADD